jgi:hypothetical protein
MKKDLLFKVFIAIVLVFTGLISLGLLSNKSNKSFDYDEENMYI